MQQTKQMEYMRRMMLSRLRILNEYGFYGLMLLHMRYGLDEECKTAYTDSTKICFNPDFLDELDDKELDFIMMHEIMHVVLKHCHRGLQYDQELFNIACDIVVNSNILKSKGMDEEAITLRKYGVSMHTIFKDEGYLYTAEEVYEKLLTKCDTISKSFDDHSHWEPLDSEADGELDTLLCSIVEMEKIKAQNGKTVGSGIPEAVLRYVKELTDSTVNWRALLDDFVTFDITDYSFLPPDRRYQGDFFMPDFNEEEDKVEEILFMVDTSGSMSIEQITDVYSEINGAIEQYDGRFKCKIGFFDDRVFEPQSFESLEDLKKIIPKGGGGTSFSVVFRYVASLSTPPRALVILTDGECDYPDPSVLGDIPLLWLINNEDNTPPYGIVGRIKY